MDKLKELYSLYLNSGLITDNISFDQFSSASEEQKDKLYGIGVEKGIFKSTNVNQFKQAWAPQEIKEVEEIESFQTGPVKETAVAGPTTEPQQQAVDTVSVLEDTSLDLPPVETYSIDGKEVSKKEFDRYTAMQEAIKTREELDTEDPSIWDRIGYELFKTKQYVFNALEDIPERAKKTYLETEAVANDFIKNVAGEDAADFLFGKNVPEGAVAFVDPETNKQILFSENPEKWKELNALNQRTDTYIKSVYAGTDQELGKAADKRYIDVMNQAEKLGKEMQYTGGGITAGFKGLVGSEGYEEYGAADLLAGGFNAVFNVLETAVPAMLTRGASIYPQIAAPMFADYNRTKAETLYPDADNALELLVENNQVEFTNPAILATIAVQSEKLGLKGLSKYIMKAPLASKSILNIARLGTVSSGEGMVEVTQGITDAINTSIAEGKTTEEVSEQVVKYMGSDQALDDFLGGFVGQAGVGAGGRAINRALRNGTQGQVKINKILTDLDELKRVSKQTKNKISKDIIQENIAQKEAELKKYLEENNQISKKLTEEERQELLGLLENKDALYSQAFDLRNQKSEGKISNKDYGYAIRSINNQAKKADSRIDEIRQEAAKREIETITEKVAKVSEKIGGKAPQIFESTEEYLDAIAKDQDIDIQEARSRAEGSEGVFAGKGKIFIDKQQAAKVGNIGVAAHEFLHPVLNALVGDLDQQQKIVEDFKKQLSKEQLRKMDVLLKPYNESEKASEYLTVFSNAIINGDIEYNESIFTRIGDYIRSLLGKYGFKNANFETGKGVYNFLKEYNKTIQKEEGLSERALELIKEREAKTGVKVSEVDVLSAPQFSKTELKDEIDTFVQKDGAKKYETKAEFQMSNDFTDAYTKIADSNLLDGSVLSIINRDDNLSGLPDNVKADIIEKTKENVSMRFLQNFDPAKNESLFGWMLGKNGALGFAVLDIKKDYAKTAKETSLDVEKGERGYVGEIAVEPTTEETIDLGIKEARAEAKLIDPVDIIPDKDLQNQYRETVQSKIKDLTEKELSFKGLKDLAPEITAEVFGVPVKKVTDATANLSKGDATNAQMFITKNADKLIKLLPEGAVLEAATEKLIGTSTGVPKKLLEAFYDKQDRITKGAGLFPYQKKANISKEDFLKAFGIIEGKKAAEFSPRSAEAQAIKGLMSMFGKLMTNTTVRKELSKDVAKELLVYNASPKSFKELGERTGLIFLATDKREAEAYAEMNRGEVKDIYIDENTIASEKQALSVMKELGVDTTEGNFYELIDPRFEEFYIGKEAMDQVTSALANNGFKAVRYEDGGQVSKTTESIVVFDKSAVSDKKVTKATIQDIAAGKSQLQFSKKARTALGLASNSINFKDKKQLTDGRNGLIKLVKALGPEKTMKYILPTVQSQWGLLGGKFAVDDSKGFTKVTKEDDKYRTNQFLTLGRKDFFDLINGTAFNSAKYEKGKTYAIINGKKIETTKVPKQTPDGFVEGKFFDDIEKRIDFAKNQRKGFEEIVNELKNLYEAGELTKNQIGMILATFNSNINGLIRTAAIPGLYFKLEGLNSDSDYRYEHTQTASDTLVDIAKYITDPNYGYSFENIMQGFRVAIIPKIYDNIVNEYYRSNGPRNIDGDLIKGSGTNVVRYNRPKVKKAIKEAGLPPLELKEANTKKEGKNLQFSKKAKILDTQFNNILENKTGIAAEKEYSAAKAEVVGASKGKFNWFIPPTAEDFTGLLYQFLGKGKLGDQQMAWFKVNLLDPYAKAMSKISRDRISTARNYRALKKELKIVPKDLKKEVPGEKFTKEQAIRVYIWHKQGYDIPGLSKTDSKDLRKFIQDNKDLKEFADKLITLNSGFDYAKPNNGWLAGTITTDLLETLNTSKRAEYLSQWQDNVNTIFSEKNLNKIEAAYGPKFRYALENVLTRMKTGRNRTYGTDSLTGRVTDWLTNSIGAIMFFNTRSAILQTISAVNFINFSDNNPLAATKAFANQKQYWSDFVKLFNSDFLVDRRDGLRLNVNESDIADMAKQSGVRGVISEILKAGFLPTQLADSFAIASGGATFYRNRLNTYLKQGIDPKKAEEMAFTEFRETAEESQQSSRPDKISAQQAGPLGRVILAFANTPAQYARLMKKAVSDLKNGRGDAKTNISKIVYYGFVQNLIFNAMQQALFGMLFGDEEEEDEKKEKKVINIANSMADSILRGMGISGAIVSVLKNTVKKLIERSEKKQPDYAENALMELLKISPPVASKASKVKNALRSYEWDKDEMYKKGLALENPAYLAAGNIVSAATNIPLDRAVKKVTNVKNALDEDLQLWQRLALLGGWSDWEIGTKKEEEKNKQSKFKTTGFKQTKFK